MSIDNSHTDHSPRVLTVIGQGYVGLPLTQAATHAGWKVYGLDLSQPLVDALGAGRSHVDDISDAEITAMLERGYEPTTDAGDIQRSQVVVICVPTPLDGDGRPDLSSVTSAAEMVGAQMPPGCLVVLESTTYPGTTERLVAPILERASGMKAGTDFWVAFSPERIDPGRKDYTLKTTPKLAGGIDAAATERAIEFYSSFVDTVVPMRGAREAETAKLLENTFRHVNIALVNEMAKFCHELDIDIWDVIKGAATKPFGFMPFTPGPGVGGHCIPIDPNYLSYEVRRTLGYPFRFVELAQEINNSMPSYVVQRVQMLLNERGRALNGAKVLLLGVTYKANIADQRESPAMTIAAEFLRYGSVVEFHDPMVPRWELPEGELTVVPDLTAAVKAADVVVLLQSHDSYDVAELSAQAAVLLDTRGTAPLPEQRL